MFGHALACVLLFTAASCVAHYPSNDPPTMASSGGASSIYSARYPSTLASESETTATEDIEQLCALLSALPLKTTPALIQLRRVQNIYDAGIIVTRDQTLQLAHKLYSVMVSSGIDIIVTRKAANLLTALLRKLRHNSKAIVGSSSPSNPVFEWKPLFETTRKTLFKEYNVPNYTGKVHSTWYFVALAKQIRNYFAPEALEEIWSHIVPNMNVLSTKIYEDALLLLIFLPTNLVNNKSQAYIHQLLKMWSWIPNSSIWDYNIVSLVQRFVKVNFPNAPWNNGTALTNNWDSLSIIYTQFVRMTGLAIGGTSLLKLPKQKAPYYIKALYPRHESTLFARLASLIIYTLPHGSQQLTQLISQLSSFFHPSNGGQFDAAIEHSKFVELLLPIVIPALYSKTVFMASAAVQASASLIYLQPDVVFEQLQQRITLSLQNPEFAHQVPTMFNLLAKVVRPLLNKEESFNSFAQTIVEYMFAAIPALDQNDPQKTASAMDFFSSALLVLPVGSGEDEPFSARSAIADQLGDWALQVLDRIFIYLGAQDKASKSESMQDRLRRVGYVTFTRRLFNVASASVRSTMTRQLLDHVKANTVADAKKQFGTLVGNAAAAIFNEGNTAAASEFLFTWLSGLTSDIVSESDSTIKISSGNDTAGFRIYLVSKLIARAGSHLQKKSVRDSLTALLDASLVFDSNKKVFNAGSRLLRKILHSQTMFYPTGNSSWHQPSGDELQWAASLIQKYSKHAALPLEEFLKTPIASLGSMTSKQRTAVRFALSLQRSLVFGSCLIYPSFEAPLGSKSFPDSDSDDSTGAKPVAAPLLNRTLLNLENLPENADGRRLVSQAYELVQSTFGDILKTLHDVAAAAIEGLAEDHALIGAVAELVFAFHSGEAVVDRGKAAAVRNQYYIAKYSYYNPLYVRGVSKKVDIPDLAARRIYSRLLQRIESTACYVPRQLTPAVTQFIKDLFEITRINPAAFQWVSRRTCDVMMRYPAVVGPTMLSRMLLPILDGTARKEGEPELPEESLSASVNLLLLDYPMAKVTRNWRNLSHFIKAILGSHLWVKANLQVNLTTLFGLAVGNFYQLPIETDADLQAYQSILRDSWQVLSSTQQQSQQAHWRYKLMALATLVTMIRIDAPTVSNPSYADLAQTFSVVLTDTKLQLPAMRALAQRGLWAVLRAARLSSEYKLTSSDVAAVFQGTALTSKLLSANQADHTPVQVTDKDEAEANNALRGRLAAVSLSIGLDISSIMQSIGGARSAGGSGDASGSAFSALVLQSRAQWPVSRLVQQSSLIDSSYAVAGNFILNNADLWQELTWAAKKVQLRSAVDDMSATIASFVDELSKDGGTSASVNEARASHVAMAELVAGFARADPFTAQPILTKIWTSITLSRALLVFPWGVSLRYVLSGDDQHVRDLQEVFVGLAAASISSTDLQSTSSQALEQKLVMSAIVLEELAPWVESSKRVASTLVYNALSSFANSSPSLRKTIADILATASSIAIPSTDADQLVPPATFVEALSSLASSAVNVTDNPAAVSPALLGLEWLLAALIRQPHHSWVSQNASKLVPVVLSLISSSDDVKTQATAILTLLSQLLTPLNSSSNLLETMTNTTRDLALRTSWKQRAPLCSFIQLFVFNHGFLLRQSSQETVVVNVLLDLIQDTQLEVREAARRSLSSVFKTLALPDDDARRKSLVETFKSWKSEKTPIKTHAAVLLLIAVVDSKPYEVPDWLPPLLDDLSKHRRDAAPIGEAVSKQLQEFFRTHQSEWDIFEPKFTSEQLSHIKNVTTPSYFA